MKYFRFKAVTPKGFPLEDSLTAVSPESAKKEIIDRLGSGTIIVYVQEAFSVQVLLARLKQSEFKKEDIIYFTDQLHSLFGSGMAIVDCLEVIESMARRKEVLDLTGKLITYVKQGASFSASCANIPNLYGPEYIALLRAGESAGALTEILGEMYRLLKWERDLSQKFKKAIRYPLVVLGFAFAAFIGVFTFIIPKFSELFQAKDAKLPAITQILLGMSKALTSHWLELLLAVVVSVVAVWVSYIRLPQVRKQINIMVLRLPLFGELYRNLIISRFSKILAILYSTGVPVVEALKICKALYTNPIFQKDMALFYDSVKRGQTLGQATSKSPIFEGLTSRMIMTGEKSGNLDVMLNKNSDIHAELVDNVVENIFTYIEPVIIVIMGLLVLCLALGVFLPMANMVSVFGR